MITMDPWPRLIFLEAEGQKTVHDFFYQMVSQYRRDEPVPDDLDVEVLEIIESLINERLIGLCNEKKKLPYYLELPVSRQDLKKAKKIMLRDGFITE